MKKIILIFLLIPTLTFAQKRYILFFSDKGNQLTEYYDNPEKVLSKTTLQKRQAAGIPVNYDDMPVCSVYVHSLTQNGIIVLRTSRWLNAALVETDIPATEIMKITPRVRNISDVSQTVARSRKDLIREEGRLITSGAVAKVNSYYGSADFQTNLIGMDYLHNLGYKGQGVTVAFFDVGFPGIDTLSCYDSLRSGNRIKGTYDFWAGSSNVYHKNDHGSRVASEVLANAPGNFVGFAPAANALFGITDDLYTETHQDEFNYVSALEWADSLGADIISASIAYSVFDPGQFNYQYSDMNGHTSITAQGCLIAAGKGLLIVNAAGDGGTICTPCDADSILCVGGADHNNQYDTYSSYGPSYDHRIKPDVAALTQNTSSVSSNGFILSGSYTGTSCATPLIAGLAVCLKQAHPTATNMQIIQAIKESANHYTAPDSLTGYGVPNARKADSILSGIVLNIPQPPVFPVSQLHTFPNPATTMVYIEDAETISTAEEYSLTGQKIKSQQVNATAGSIDVTSFPSGIYMVFAHYKSGNSRYVKIIRQ